MAADRVLRVLLGVMVLDTAYLSWRYLALRAGAVVPGTGLCSWTGEIDCDIVLSTPQARAFFVPNALLGFGFYFGCALWWMLGSRLYPGHRRRLLRTLVFWLAVGGAVTLRFWQLLLSLPALCPFCPWNHLLSLGALGAAWVLLRGTGEDDPARPTRQLVPLVLLCVAQLFVWLAVWGVAVKVGLLPAGPTIFG